MNQLRVIQYGGQVRTGHSQAFGKRVESYKSAKIRQIFYLPRVDSDFDQLPLLFTDSGFVGFGIGLLIVLSVHLWIIFRYKSEPDTKVGAMIHPVREMEEYSLRKGR